MEYDQQEVSMSSKKERKALKRQQKIEEQMRKTKKRTIRRLVVWALIIFGLLGAVFGMIIFVSQSSPVSPGPSVLTPVADTEWIKGNKDAPITIVEYSDFQCPGCASYYLLLKKLADEFKDDVRVVYRHFPLRRIHKNADLAAMASEAAGMQGNFWGMHDMIFDNQKEWSDEKNAQELFMEYARLLGLDMGRFAEDLVSGAARERVDEDYQSGIQAKVNSTPSLFLNGIKIKLPRNYGELREVIE